MKVVSHFDVVSFDSKVDDDAAIPVQSTASIKKQFHGPLEATSVATMLGCQGDPADFSAGAGYVASEQVDGSLDGKTGTFVLQHWGISDVSGNRTGGHIVPGSGTGALAGLTGTMEISVADDGTHTLTLDYELP